MENTKPKVNTDGEAVGYGRACMEAEEPALKIRDETVLHNEEGDKTKEGNFGGLTASTSAQTENISEVGRLLSDQRIISVPFISDSQGYGSELEQMALKSMTPFKEEKRLSLYYHTHTPPNTIVADGKGGAKTLGENHCLPVLDERCPVAELNADLTCQQGAGERIHCSTGSSDCQQANVKSTVTVSPSLSRTVLSLEDMESEAKLPTTKTKVKMAGQEDVGYGEAQIVTPQYGQRMENETDLQGKEEDGTKEADFGGVTESDGTSAQTETDPKIVPVTSISDLQECGSKVEQIALETATLFKDGKGLKVSNDMHAPQNTIVDDQLVADVNGGAKTLSENQCLPALDGRCPVTKLTDDFTCQHGAGERTLCPSGNSNYQLTKEESTSTGLHSLGRTGLSLGNTESEPDCPLTAKIKETMTDREAVDCGESQIEVGEYGQRITDETVLQIKEHGRTNEADFEGLSVSGVTSARTECVLEAGRLLTDSGIFPVSSMSNSQKCSSKLKQISLETTAHFKEEKGLKVSYDMHTPQSTIDDDQLVASVNVGGKTAGENHGLSLLDVRCPVTELTAEFACQEGVEVRTHCPSGHSDYQPSKEESTSAVLPLLGRTGLSLEKIEGEADFPHTTKMKEMTDRVEVDCGESQKEAEEYGGRILDETVLQIKGQGRTKEADFGGLTSSDITSTRTESPVPAMSNSQECSSKFEQIALETTAPFNEEKGLKVSYRIHAPLKTTVDDQLVSDVTGGGQTPSENQCLPVLDARCPVTKLTAGLTCLQGARERTLCPSGNSDDPREIEVSKITVMPPLRSTGVLSEHVESETDFPHKIKVKMKMTGGQEVDCSEAHMEAEEFELRTRDETGLQNKEGGGTKETDFGSLTVPDTTSAQTTTVSEVGRLLSDAMIIPLSSISDSQECASELGQIELDRTTEFKEDKLKPSYGVHTPPKTTMDDQLVADVNGGAGTLSENQCQLVFDVRSPVPEFTAISACQQAVGERTDCPSENSDYQPINEENTISVLPTLGRTGLSLESIEGEADYSHRTKIKEKMSDGEEVNCGEFHIEAEGYGQRITDETVLQIKEQGRTKEADFGGLTASDVTSAETENVSKVGDLLSGPKIIPVPCISDSQEVKSGQIALGPTNQFKEEEELKDSVDAHTPPKTTVDDHLATDVNGRARTLGENRCQPVLDVSCLVTELTAELTCQKAAGERTHCPAGNSDYQPVNKESTITVLPPLGRTGLSFENRQSTAEFPHTTEIKEKMTSRVAVDCRESHIEALEHGQRTLGETVLQNQEGGRTKGADFGNLTKPHGASAVTENDLEVRGLLSDPKIIPVPSISDSQEYGSESEQSALESTAPFKEEKGLKVSFVICTSPNTVVKDQQVVDMNRGPRALSEYRCQPVLDGTCPVTELTTLLTCQQGAGERTHCPSGNFDYQLAKEESASTLLPLLGRTGLPFENIELGANFLSTTKIKEKMADREEVEAGEVHMKAEECRLKIRDETGLQNEEVVRTKEADFGGSIASDVTSERADRVSEAGRLHSDPKISPVPSISDYREGGSKLGQIALESTTQFKEEEALKVFHDMQTPPKTTLDNQLVTGVNIGAKTLSENQCQPVLDVRCPVTELTADLTCPKAARERTHYPSGNLDYQLAKQDGRIAVLPPLGTTELSFENVKSKANSPLITKIMEMTTNREQVEGSEAHTVAEEYGLRIIDETGFQSKELGGTKEADFGHSTVSNATLAQTTTATEVRRLLTDPKLLSVPSISDSRECGSESEQSDLESTILFKEEKGLKVSYFMHTPPNTVVENQQVVDVNKGAKTLSENQLLPLLDERCPVTELTADLTCQQEAGERTHCSSGSADYQPAKEEGIITVSPPLCRTGLSLEEMTSKANFPHTIVPLQRFLDETFSTHTQGLNIADERTEDKAGMSGALQQTKIHVSTLMHSSVVLGDAENKVELVPAVNYMTSELKCLEPEASSLSPSKLNESLSNCQNFAPIISKREHAETDMPPLTVMKEQLSLEPEIKSRCKKGRKKSAMPVVTASFPQECDAGTSYSYEPNSQFSPNWENYATDQQQMGVINKSKYKRNGLKINREISVKSVHMDRMDATINPEPSKTVLNTNSSQSQPSKKCQKKTKTEISSQFKTELSRAGRQTVDSIDIKSEERAGQSENSLKSITEGRAVAEVPHIITGKWTTEISSEALTENVFLKNAIPCAEQPVGNATETTGNHVVMSDGVENEKKLIDSQPGYSNLTESFEMVKKSTGIGKKLQRKRKKKRAMRKKRAQTKLEVNEFIEPDPISGIGDKLDIHSHCKNEAEMQIAQQVSNAQDKEEDPRDKSPSCLRENENISGPGNICGHNSQILKTKKGKKAKQLTLLPSEAHLRNYCGDITVDLPVPEETHQSPTVEANHFIQKKSRKKRRARKSKRKSQVKDLENQETCIIIHKEEGGATGDGTTVASNASKPNDTLIHIMNKESNPRKIAIKETDIQQNLQTVSEVISSSFELQSQNVSEIALVVSPEVKNRLRGNLKNSATKKNVRKSQKQRISRVSPMELAAYKEQSADPKISDPTNSLLSRQLGGGETVSTFTRSDKEAQCDMKKEMKAENEELMTVSSVKEEHMGAEERLKVLKISGPIGKLKKKRGRPYKKKTLMKMEAELFAGKQRLDEMEVSAPTKLGNDLLPQDIIAHVPQRYKVRKISKKVRQGLSPPVTNLTGYSQACKSTTVEKMEEHFAPDHNLLNLLTGPTDSLNVQRGSVSFTPAGPSALETSNETDALKLIDQKPKRQRRLPKNRTLSQAINDKDGGQESLLIVHEAGAEAKSLKSKNLVLVKEQKRGYSKKKILKEEITCIQENVQTIPVLPGKPEQQGHNISKVISASSPEIKMDIEGPSRKKGKKPRKKVKNPKKEKCISTLVTKELIDSTESKMDVVNRDTTDSLIIPQKAECEMMSTLLQVNKSENCNHERMKGVKEEILEPESAVGEYTNADIVGPKTSGTVLKSKRLCKKKTQKRENAKKPAAEQRSNCVGLSAENQLEKNFPLDMTFLQADKCKIKKESKKVGSLPPVTHSTNSSQACKITLADEMENDCAQNPGKSILPATSGSTSQLIFPKGEISQSPAVSYKPHNFHEHMPHRHSRALKKGRKPPKRKAKGQRGSKQILSVHENEVGASPVSPTKGTTELIPKSFRNHSAPQCNNPLKQILKDETVFIQENMPRIVSGNVSEQQTCNVPTKALAPLLDIQKNSPETIETSLSIRKKIKCRIQKPNSKTSPKVMFDNTELRTDMSPGVDNGILIPQQSKTFGTVKQIEAIHGNIKKRKTARKQIIKPASSLEGPRKTEDVFAILQSGGAATKVKRKLGRPYKKKTLLKMVKQLPFIEEPELNGADMTSVNQMDNHSGPQEISSNQVQGFKQKKTHKKVKLARPPTPVAQLRRYSRACKVSTDYTFEKIKERLEYNLKLSSSAYVSDTTKSLTEMEVKQKILVSEEPEKTSETIVQFTMKNTAPTEVQSLSQEHSNIKNLESHTVLNSLEHRVHEDTKTCKTLLSLDTGTTPSFQEIVELNTIDRGTKKPRKTSGSKNKGRKRRRTWWDDRGKAKILLDAALGSAREASQNEGTLQLGLQEQLVKQNNNSDSDLLTLGQRVLETYSDSDLSGAQLNDSTPGKADWEIRVDEGPLANSENCVQHISEDLEAATSMNSKSQELTDQEMVKEQNKGHVYSRSAEVLPNSCSSVEDAGTIHESLPQKPEKEMTLLSPVESAVHSRAQLNTIEDSVKEGKQANIKPNGTTVDPLGLTQGAHEESKHQKRSVTREPRVLRDRTPGKIKQNAHGANLMPVEISQSTYGIPHTAVISTESESSAWEKAQEKVKTTKNDSSKTLLNHSGKVDSQVVAEMEEKSVLIKDVQKDMITPGARKNMKKRKTVKAAMVMPISTPVELRKDNDMLAILKTGGAITKGKRKRGRPFKKKTLKKMAKQLAFIEEQILNGTDIATIHQFTNFRKPQEISSCEETGCKQRKKNKKDKLASPPTPIANLRRYSRACKVTTNCSFDNIKDPPRDDINLPSSTYFSDTCPLFPGIEVKQELMQSVETEKSSETIVQFAPGISAPPEVQINLQEDSNIETLKSSAVVNTPGDSKVHEVPSLSLDTGITPFQQIVELNNGLDLVTKKPRKNRCSKKKGKKRRRSLWDDRGKANKLLKAPFGTVLGTSQDEGRFKPALEEKMADVQNYNSDTKLVMNCTSRPSNDLEVGKKKGPAHVYSQNTALSPNSCISVGDTKTIDEILPQNPEKEAKGGTSTMLSHDESYALSREQQNTTEYNLNLISSTHVSDSLPSFCGVEVKPEIIGSAKTEKTSETIVHFATAKTVPSEVQKGFSQEHIKTQESISVLNFQDDAKAQEDSTVFNTSLSLASRKTLSFQKIIEINGLDLATKKLRKKNGKKRRRTWWDDRGKANKSLKATLGTVFETSQGEGMLQSALEEKMGDQQSYNSDTKLLILGHRIHEKHSVSDFSEAQLCDYNSEKADWETSGEGILVCGENDVHHAPEDLEPANKMTCNSQELKDLEIRKEEDTASVYSQHPEVLPNSCSSVKDMETIDAILPQKQENEAKEEMTALLAEDELAAHSREQVSTTENHLHFTTSTYLSGTLPSFPVMEVQPEKTQSVETEKTSETLVHFASAKTAPSKVHLSQEHSHIKTLESSTVLNVQEDTNVHEDTTTFNTSLLLDTGKTPSFQEIGDLNSIALGTKKSRKTKGSKKRGMKKTWWEDRGKTGKLIKATLGTVLKTSADEGKLQPALDEKIPNEQIYDSCTKLLILRERKHEKYSHHISGAKLHDFHSEKADCEISVGQGPLGNDESNVHHAPEDVEAANKMTCKSSQLKDLEISKEEDTASVYNQNHEDLPNSCSSVGDPGTIDAILPQKQENGTTECRLNFTSSTYLSDTLPGMGVKPENTQSIETEKTSENFVHFASAKTAPSKVQSLSQEHSHTKTLESDAMLNVQENTNAHGDTTTFSTCLSLGTGKTPSFQEIPDLNSIALVTKKPRKTIGRRKRGKKRKKTWWDDRGKASKLIKATLGTVLKTSHHEQKLPPALEEKIPNEQMYNSHTKVFNHGERIHQNHSHPHINGAQLYDCHSEKADCEISVGQGPLGNDENDAHHAPVGLEAANKMTCKSRELNYPEISKEQDIAHVCSQNPEVLPNSCSLVGDTGTIDAILPQEQENEEETTALLAEGESAAHSREQVSTTECHLNFTPSTNLSDTLPSFPGMEVKPEKTQSVETERTSETILHFASAKTAPSKVQSLSQEHSHIKTLESSTLLNGQEDTKVQEDTTTFSTCLSLATGKTPSFQEIPDLKSIALATKKPRKTIGIRKRGKKRKKTWWDDRGKTSKLIKATLGTVLKTSHPEGKLQPSLEEKIPNEQIYNSHTKLLILGERKHEKYSEPHKSETQLYDFHSEKADCEISVAQGPLGNDENYVHAPVDLEAANKMTCKSPELKDPEISEEQDVAHLYSPNLEVLPNPCSSVGDNETINAILPQEQEDEAKEETTSLLTEGESAAHSKEQDSTPECRLNFTPSTNLSDTLPSFPGMEVKPEKTQSVETERTSETILHFASAKSAPSKVQILSQEHSYIETLESSTVLNVQEDTKVQEDTTTFSTCLSFGTGKAPSFQEIPDLNSIALVPKKPRKTIGIRKRGKKRKKTWWDDRGKTSKLIKAALGTVLKTSHHEGKLQPSLEGKIPNEQIYNSHTKVFNHGERKHENCSDSHISGAQLYDFHSEQADCEISEGEGPLGNDEKEIQHASEDLEATSKMSCKSQESKDLELEKQDNAHVCSQNAEVLPNSCCAVGAMGTVSEFPTQEPEKETKEEITTLLSHVESAVHSREELSTTEDQVKDGEPEKIKPTEGLDADLQSTVAPLGHMQGTHKKNKWQKLNVTTEPRVLRDRPRVRLKQDVHGANLTLSQSHSKVPHTSLESTKEGSGKLEIEIISKESESSAQGKALEEELKTKKYSSEALLNHSHMEDSQEFAKVEEQSTLIKDVHTGKSGIEMEDTSLSEACSTRSSFSKLLVSHDQEIGGMEMQEDGKGEQLEDADKSDRNSQEGDTAEKITCKPNLTANPSERLVSVCQPKKGKFPAKCHFCGRSFRHITAYIIHRRIHTGEKPYGCRECGKTFSQLSQLNVHKKVHKLPGHLKCPLCTSRFSLRDKLLSHFLTHTNYLNQKNLTGESADDSAGIKAKISTRVSRSAFRLQDVKTFKCRNCGKRFRYSVSLKRHICTQRGDKPFSCKVCDKAFNKAFKLSDHEKIHWSIKPFACSVCGKAFSQLGALKTHSRTHTGERPFTCAHCGDSFLQLSSLRTHQKSKLCLSKGTGEDENNGFLEDFVECQILEMDENPTVIFQCQVCNKSYDTQSEYKLHQLTHANVETSLCEACGLPFKSSDHNANQQICCRPNGMESQNESLSEVDDASQLQHNQPAQSSEHMQMLPLDNQQSKGADPSVNTMPGSGTQPEESSKSADQLEICQSTSTDSRLVSSSPNGSIGPHYELFKSPPRLQSHLLTSTPRYSYKCGRCGKALESWNKYWLHQRVHRQKPGGFCCPQCSQHFRFHGLYKEHMLEHAKQTPYACPVCPCAFADKESLMFHQGEEHKDCNTHKCLTCGRHFTNLRNLERHNLRHRGTHPRRCSRGSRSVLHSGVLSCPLTTNLHSIPQPDVPAEAVSLYRCGECNVKFPTLDTLAVHQLCHSTGDRNPLEEREIVAGSLAPEYQRAQSTPSPTTVLCSSPLVTPDQHESLYAYQHPDNLYVYPTPSTSFPPPVLPSITNVPSYHKPSEMNTSNTAPLALLNVPDSNKVPVQKKYVHSDHLYAAPPRECQDESPSHSTSVSFLATQPNHPPEPHMSEPLQMSSTSLSRHESWAQASPNAQVNVSQFRSNGDSSGDFSSFPISYVKLKNKEEMHESLECAECGTLFGSVSELYEHYIQHARGEL